jgi:hypothetical protein
MFPVFENVSTSPVHFMAEDRCFQCLKMYRLLRYALYLKRDNASSVWKYIDFSSALNIWRAIMFPVFENVSTSLILFIVKER